MATRMLRVCDVCDQPVEGDPIRFGWGNAFYETDLCAKHGDDLVSLMERAVQSARRLGAPPKSVPPVPTKQRRSTVNTKEVREWAAKKGIEVSDRGRVPEALIVQFLAATE
jgi:hypothetical protein